MSVKAYQSTADFMSWCEKTVERPFLMTHTKNCKSHIHHTTRAKEPRTSVHKRVIHTDATISLILFEGRDYFSPKLHIITLKVIIKPTAVGLGGLRVTCSPRDPRFAG